MFTYSEEGTNSGRQYVTCGFPVNLCHVCCSARYITFHLLGQGSTYTLMRSFQTPRLAASAGASDRAGSMPLPARQENHDSGVHHQLLTLAQSLAPLSQKSPQS